MVWVVPALLIVALSIGWARRSWLAERRRVDATFRTLIEAVPETIGVHSGGKLVYLNPALLRLFGYQRLDEVAGKPAMDSVHPDDRAEVMARMKEMALTGKPAPLREVRFLRKDGSAIQLETASLPLIFDGKPSFLVVGRDLTERKQTQARLMMADRMVSIGTLAAGVAHEINNPLAYVVSNLEYVASELDAIAAAPEESGSRIPETVVAVREACEGAERVRLIVRDLKLFSRAPEATNATADVERVLESSIRMAANEIKHRARLVRRLGGVPPVHGDAARLGQVFLNLLVNAAQAIGDRDPLGNAITVATEHDAAAGRVRVTIEDTGCGMTSEVRARLFSPFFTTKPVGVGTGLGLFVCHGIVHALGGEITVASEVGKGTAFTVSFAVAQAIAAS